MRFFQLLEMPEGWFDCKYRMICMWEQSRWRCRGDPVPWHCHLNAQAAVKCQLKSRVKLRLDRLLVEHQFGQESHLLRCFFPFEFSLQAVAVLGLFPGVKLELLFTVAETEPCRQCQWDSAESYKKFGSGNHYSPIPAGPGAV